MQKLTGKELKELQHEALKFKHNPMESFKPAAPIQLHLESTKSFDSVEGSRMYLAENNIDIDKYLEKGFNAISKKEFIQINFEVLGKVFCFYSPMTNPIPFDHFELEIKKIAPSGHVVNICTTIVDEKTAAEFDFKKCVQDWNIELDNRFQDEEALIELQHG